MSRKRMLDPDFFLDEELVATNPYTRLLYQGLWGICDDNYATLPHKPNWIKMQIFPYEDVDIIKHLRELHDISKIILFQEDGKDYWYIKNFFKYQTVDRPSKPKYPEFKRSKMVGMGLFEGLKQEKLSTLVEGSSSTRQEVKEVKEVKEEFSMKKKKTENVDNSRIDELKKSIGDKLRYKN